MDTPPQKGLLRGENIFSNQHIIAYFYQKVNSKYEILSDKY